jgi:hypothetical protein
LSPWRRLKKGGIRDDIIEISFIIRFFDSVWRSFKFIVRLRLWFDITGM